MVYFWSFSYDCPDFVVCSIKASEQSTTVPFNIVGKCCLGIGISRDRLVLFILCFIFKRDIYNWSYLNQPIFNSRAILSLSTLSASSLKCQPLCIVYQFLYSFIRISFLPSLNILNITFVYKSFTVDRFLQNCCCCLDLVVGILFNLVIWTITLLTVFVMDS